MGNAGEGARGGQEQGPFSSSGVVTCMVSNQHVYVVTCIVIGMSRVMSQPSTQCTATHRGTGALFFFPPKVEKEVIGAQIPNPPPPKKQKQGGGQVLV
jgi:hypothetical protein